MVIQIGVIGTGECTPEEARTAGWVAIREAVLVCRGLRGVMEAAVRGAKKAKGTTVGIPLL